MDKDPEAIAQAEADFGSDPRVAIRRGSFADLATWHETEAGLDGVLFDLGVSSPQIDDARRGFSFRNDGPLDMRMDNASGESAADWLARADADEIADVLWTYGEERMSRRIAKAIVAQRVETPITRTTQLADLIASIVGRGADKIHPATRSFQGIRIFINRELDDIEAGLAAAHLRLKAGGRLAVISFHSLEDRIVKRFVRAESQQAPTRHGLPPPAPAVLRLKPVGGAQFPGATETALNPRSRSAVLRVAERL
jgi:16S rRNA (cytosine1402-N4)-methyltransferase